MLKLAYFFTFKRQGFVLWHSYKKRTLVILDNSGYNTTSNAVLKRKYIIL